MNRISYLVKIIIWTNLNQRKYNVVCSIPLGVLALLTMSYPLGEPIHAAAAHTSGYNHGCSDAQMSNPSDRYISQPEKGPSFHINEFMNAYHAGFNACSGSGRGTSGGGNEFTSNSGGQSGYSLTVNVSHHPFGDAWVYIWIKDLAGEVEISTKSATSVCVTNYQGRDYN
jgi:hypothetical protein